MDAILQCVGLINTNTPTHQHTNTHRLTSPIELGGVFWAEDGTLPSDQTNKQNQTYKHMQVKIKNVRLSFSNLRKPYTPKTGDPKYTFTGICSADSTVEATIDDKKVTVPSTDFEKIILAKVCKDKWGKTPAKLELFVYSKADQQVGSRGPKINEDGDFYDGYDANTMFFSAGTKVADAPNGILIVDQKRQPLPASTGMPNNGDYVNAIINIFCFEQDGKKGISASIEAVQYLRKGESFGTAKVTVDAFEDEEMEDLDADDSI